MATREILKRRLSTIRFTKEQQIVWNAALDRDPLRIARKYLNIKEYWRLRQVSKRWKERIEYLKEPLEQKAGEAFEVTLWKNEKGQERAYVTMRGGGPIHPMFKVDRTFYTTTALKPVKLLRRLSKASANSFKEKKPRKKKTDQIVTRPPGSEISPIEIYSKILGYLTVPELWEMRLVCKEWKEMIEDEAFIRPIFLEQYDFLPSHAIGDEIKTFYVCRKGRIMARYLGKYPFPLTKVQLEKSVAHIISLLNTKYKRERFVRYGQANVKMNASALRSSFTGGCDMEELKFLQRMIAHPAFLKEVYEMYQTAESE